MIRLIDLHTDWLLQYAPETTVFDPTLYARVSERLGQAEGYLQGTWAAVLSCYRTADDWVSQADPWSALGALITRIEAEFSGRLLIGPADVARWLDDAEGLCWGLIGIEGFDALMRGPEDLERLPRLFERGVRLFQPVYGPTSVLAGSSAHGDDRGLTDLGRAFLETLADLRSDDGDGPRPLLDLAHLNPKAAAEVLSWLEADPGRPLRVLPVYSHGALSHPENSSPRTLTLDNLARLRALGGVVGFSVGPPFYSSREQLKASIETAAAIPFQGRSGFEGLAIGTDFLGVARTLPGLGNIADVAAWLTSSFSPAEAAALIQGNGRRLILDALDPEGTPPPVVAQRRGTAPGSAT
jgi:membrane dipeptidase